MSVVGAEVRKLLGAMKEASPGSSMPNLGVDGYVALIFTAALFLFNWIVRLCVVAPLARVRLALFPSRGDERLL